MDLRADVSSEVVRAIISCVNFAAIKHTYQKRKDPERTPYINHPIGVAHILIDEGNVTDLEVIQAAILHDTVEDTDTTIEELTKVFGKNIADLVGELSDDKTKPSWERKQAQIDHAVSSSHKAKLVKLADKIYNLRDLYRVTPEGWSELRVEEYFVWAQKVVLGLRGTNQPMEDILDGLFARRGL